MTKVSELPATDCPILQSIRLDYAAWGVDTFHLGYVRYYQRGQAHYEHRLVAQCAFSSLPNRYFIHHINDDRADNRAVNLRVMTPSQHAHFYKGYRRYFRIICPVCDAPRSVTLSELNRRPVLYCSQQCAHFASRVVEWPSPAELERLIQEYDNWSALGRLFGVSDNAVRKWARRYGLL